MKIKVISLFMACFLISAPVFAQNNTANDDRSGRMEVYLGYGSPSCIPYFVGFFAGIGGALAGADKVNNHMYGTASAGLNFYMTNWFLMGLYGSYERFGISFDDDSDTITNLATIQGRLQLQYGPKYVKFYHAVNAGAMFNVNDSESDAGFICGLVPFGLNVGCTENLSLYAEIGLISNAFITGGVKYIIP